MKSVLLSILMFTIAVLSYSQDFKKLSQTEFKTSEQSKKAEPTVIKACDYLLNNPVSSEKGNRSHAFQYIFGWMQATSDYSFAIDDKVIKLVKGDDNLLVLYMTAIAKTALESSAEKIDNDDLFSKAASALIIYTSIKENGVKPSREMKKMIKKMKKQQ